MQRRQPLAAEPTKAARSPLPARSAKTKRVYSESRVPLVKRLLAEHPYCQACTLWAQFDGKVTFIQQPSQDVHEVQSRGRGGSILDETNLLCVCRPCHRRITENPTEAGCLGLSAPAEWEVDPVLAAAEVRASWNTEDPIPAPWCGGCRSAAH